MTIFIRTCVMRGVRSKRGDIFLKLSDDSIIPTIRNYLTTSDRGNRSLFKSKQFRHCWSCEYGIEAVIKALELFGAEYEITNYFDPELEDLNK
tara:strand:- start:3234 stop:3512 length:279 start_codon:yes stop_codon:yes gene_type:complete